AATGGTGAFTYAWTPGGGTNLTASGLSAQGYTITATDANGCTATANATITQPAAPAITIASQVNVLCFGNNTGSITANAATGGTGAFTYAWTPSGGTTLTASSLTAQGYTITATDANGCTATANTTITQPAASVAITIASQVNVLCNGNSTGSITANAATGGTSPYTYAWTPSGGTNLTASSLSAQAYTITATDANGCTATANATITQPATAPAITIASQVNELCNGNSTGSITANAATGGTGAFTYAWTPSGGTNLTANGLTAQGYTITATDANGCIADASTIITEPAALTASASVVSDITCAGGSNGNASATPAGGTSPYTFSWENSGSVVVSASNPTGAILNAGNYTVTVSDINGCNTTATVALIDLNPLPTVSITATSVNICSGNADTLSASDTLGDASPLMYSWNTGATGNSINFIPVGSPTYTLTVTDANGCINSATQGITVNPLPSVSISGNVIGGFTICSGNVDTLDASASGGSGSGYNFSWSDGSNAATDLETTAGTYTVSVTDGNGCMNIASQAVTVNTTPTIVVSPDNAGICPGGNVNLGASGASTYTWSPNTALSATTGNTVNSTPTVTTTYTVIGTSSQGCVSANETATVTVSSTLNVSVTPANPVICLNDSVTLNGNGASLFTWRSSNGLTCTSCPSPMASPTVTTTYTVVGTSGVCADSANVTVTVNPLPSVTVSGNVISGFVVCAGSIDSLNAIAAGGSGSGYTFTWSNGTSTQNDWVTTAGTYSVMVTDGNGCIASSANQLVTVNSLPSVNIFASSPAICQGNIDTLAAIAAGGSGSGYTFTWSNGSTNQNDLVTTAGTYTVRVVDADGCSALSPIDMVVVNSLPAASITVSSSAICMGNIDTLSVIDTTGDASPLMYSWNTGGSNDSIIVAPTTGTSYSVTVTDANGCMDTTSQMVIVNPLPTITIAADTNTIQQGGNDILEAGGGVSYIWTDGSMNDTANVMPTVTTTYTVTGTGSDGCSDTASFTVNVVIETSIKGLAPSDKTTLYPNPAIDNINLSFVMQGNNKPATIQIIDAMGKEVISENLSIGNGKILTMDVSTLAQGMYFVKVITNEKTQVVQFIKQ
ncbi:MAG: beta strand repeat-containing protein, partial [Bacteroidia bacterium]